MIPLADTLVALVESLAVPDEPGLTVTSATIDLPLEGGVTRVNGVPTFFAHAPHSRWRSGVLPPVHVAHVLLAQDEG